MRSPTPPPEQPILGVDSHYPSQATGRFFKIFALCLVVSAPTCGFLSFATALAAMGRAFGPRRERGSTEVIYDLTQFPLAGHDQATLIINSVFWGICISLLIALIWTIIAGARERARYDAKSRGNENPGSKAE